MVGTNDAFLMFYPPTLPRRSRRRWRRSSCWGRWNAGRGARRRWRRGHRLPGVRRLRPSRERDLVALGVHALHVGHVVAVLHRLVCARGIARAHGRPSEETPARADRRPDADRKSTRLNSSHLVISYAVFCLKKKKKINSIHENTKLSSHNRRRQSASTSSL